MFRQEFFNVMSKYSNVPVKVIRDLSANRDPKIISEFELLKQDLQFDYKGFAKAIAEKYSLKHMDLTGAKIPKATLRVMKRSDIIRYRVIPIQKNDKMVLLTTYDPSVVVYASEVQQILKCEIDYLVTNLPAWKDIYEGVEPSVDEVLESIKLVTVNTKKDDDGPPIKLEEIGEEVVLSVNKILAEAYLRKASDIHMEPYEKRFRIRFRIDGDLVEYPFPQQSLVVAMISRMKIMAQMDIAERRKPQDGRIKLKIGDDTIDYRVSSLPTLFGEKMVLRLLDQSNLQLDMTKLGFETKQLEHFKEGIHRPYGMCLVTGPTGSGKTTTLYSALADLNTADVNISTVEDPVEFNLEGINQVNVRKDIGYTFASALKSFLRQDPDIIMVGEIRDTETAEIAVEAALTGHLVLSTLHTNDAPSTIMRLLNMGIEPFLITGALNVVVAQRLCRRICVSCKAPVQVDPEVLIKCGIASSSVDKIKVSKGMGCEFCHGTGYKGRVAIYEVLYVTSEIKEMIIRNCSAEELKRVAIKEGMKTLRMSALTKVAMGLTTLEEAIANSSSDS